MELEIVPGKNPLYDHFMKRQRDRLYPCDIHGYNICCEARPYQRGMAGRWQHPKAEFDRTDYDFIDGDATAHYKCSICGLEFGVYVPR